MTGWLAATLADVLLVLSIVALAALGCIVLSVIWILLDPGDSGDGYL